MKLDPITIAALAHAREVQAERQRCEAAVVAHSGATLPVLRQAREGAAQALAEAEAALYASLAVVDTVAADKAEALCAPLAATRAAADHALERAERVDVVLRKNLSRAEADQAAEVVALRAGAQQCGHVFSQQLAAEMREAAAPLIAVVRRAAAVAGAAGLPHILQSLDTLLIPDLSSPAVPILNGRFPGRLDDDEAAELARVVGEPMRVLRELENLVPLATREAAAAALHGRHAGRDTLAATPPSVAEDTPSTPPRVIPSPAARHGRVASAAVRLA